MRPPVQARGLVKVGQALAAVHGDDGTLSPDLHAVAPNFSHGRTRGARQMRPSNSYRVMMGFYALGLLVIVALAIAGVEPSALVTLYALAGLLMAAAMCLMTTGARRRRRP